MIVLEDVKKTYRMGEVEVGDSHRDNRAGVRERGLGATRPDRLPSEGTSQE